MGGKPFVILMVTLCVWTNYQSQSEVPAPNASQEILGLLKLDPDGHSESSPALSPLRQALRRSVRATPRIDPAACIDTSQCASTPNVCTEDADLGAALCPALCGACVCEDDPSTKGNCTALVPDICQVDFGANLCAKTCKVCGDTGAIPCEDHLSGIECKDLPDVCSDSLGKTACPEFCGLCNGGSAPQTTSAPQSGVCSKAPCLNSGVCSVASNANGFVCACPTGFTGTICESKPDICTNGPCLNSGTCSLASNSIGFVCACPAGYTGTICESKVVSATPDPSCPIMLKDKGSFTCQQGEIVFMIEYSYKDSSLSIDHEGDFIKELVDGWRIRDNGIRFGVVVYHDTVSEAIDITEFADDPEGLKRRISSLTRFLRPSGTADLAKAINFVRDNSFKSARPNVAKVVIPIVHQMSNVTKANIVPATQKLKDDCVSIVGLAIGDSSLDYEILHDAVTQPYQSFYQYHRTFYDLENTGKFVNAIQPSCSSSTP